jgi:diaminopimelate epimerase
VRFSKYHGTGNDFVLVQDVDDRLRLDQILIEAVCDRRQGIGADGLIRIVRATDADFFMDYYNADGQVAEMCGNGIRCLAKYVYDRGLIDKNAFDVMTRAGLKRVVVEADNGVAARVTVGMGLPEFERKAIPMTGRADEQFIDQPLDVDGRLFTATALSMGNPHCVLVVDPSEDLEALEVPRLGTEVEHRPEFPNRTNVEFVQAAGGTLRARVWERGSGETMACGTGACAAVVASSLAGLSGPEADIEFPGGVLHVAWREGDDVYLTGPAVWVYDGELSAEWTSEATVGDGRTPARAMDPAR